MQSSAKATGRPRCSDDACATGRSDSFGSRPFGPAEMGEQDDPAALVRDLPDRRQHALDAGRVGDAAVLHRHVEVDPDQNPLALEAAGVVKGAERSLGQNSGQAVLEKGDGDR